MQGTSEIEVDSPLPPLGRHSGTPERLGWAVVATVATAAAIGLGIVLFARTSPEPAPIRFNVSAPAGYTFARDPAAPHPAVSPDGRRVAFVVIDKNGHGMLAVQSFDALQPEVIPGTNVEVGFGVAEGSGLPFWSPDSRFIGFFAQGKLKKVDVNGGPSEELCPAPNGEGGTWNSEGTILFAPSPTSALFRVPAAGGTPTPVTMLDSGRKEVGHRWPWFLPDGRRFLYVTTASNRVYVGSLDSPERVELSVESDSKALYSAGQLLFVRQGTLRALGFDADRLMLTGDESVPVVGDIGAINDRFGTRAAFSASTGGTLTYRTTASPAQRQLVWVDRRGTQVDVLGDAAPYQQLELAGDGSRAAITIADGAGDIWVIDVPRGVRTKLTSDPADEMFPIWSPGGDQIVFTRHGAKPGLYLESSGGTGGEELLLASDDARSVFPRGLVPMSWSPDEQFLIYGLNDPKTGWDLWVLPLANRTPSPLVQMPDFQGNGRFSPDGRWIAYSSTETGRPEIFVVSFPDLRKKRLVSRAGGSSVRWRRDGRELFYLAPGNTLMAAEVNGQGVDFQVVAERSLFQPALPSGVIDPYDVSKDGQRFLVITPAETQQSSVMTVVVNWSAGLRN
jgi:Tol biopolymer transport system component